MEKVSLKSAVRNLIAAATYYGYYSDGSQEQYDARDDCDFWEKYIIERKWEINGD